MSDLTSLSLHKLPDDAAELIQELDVHPYLLAHLILVHDAARRLVTEIGQRWPQLELDEELVLYGAATHDIGKFQHPEEMMGPGHRHHAAGEKLLAAQGVTAERARFARTHGAWQEQRDLPTEDLIVSLADVVWSGGRDRALEAQITERFAAASGLELWQTYMDLDDILTDITNDAELRLVWQTQFAPDPNSLEQSGQAGPEI